MKNSNISLLLFLKVEQGDHNKVESFLDSYPQLVNEQNPKSGQTLLTVATRRNDLQMIMILIGRGADVNLPNKLSQSALWICCFQSSPEICELLLSRGANPNQQDKKGWTPLMFACHKGHHGIIKQLIEAGANLQSQTNKGENIFDLAKDYDTLQILTHLLGIDQVKVKQPEKIKSTTQEKRHKKQTSEATLTSFEVVMEQATVVSRTPIKLFNSQSATRFHSAGTSPSRTTKSVYQSEIEQALDQIQTLFTQQFQVIKNYLHKQAQSITTLEQLVKVIAKIPVGITQDDDPILELQCNQFKTNFTKVVSSTMSVFVTAADKLEQFQQNLKTSFETQRVSQQRKFLLIQQEFEPLLEIPEEEKTPISSAVIMLSRTQNFESTTTESKIYPHMERKQKITDFHRGTNIEPRFEVEQSHSENKYMSNDCN